MSAHLWLPDVGDHEYEPGAAGWCVQCGGHRLDPLHPSGWDSPGVRGAAVVQVRTTAPDGDEVAVVPAPDGQTYPAFVVEDAADVRES